MYRRGGFFIFAVLREDYHENLLNRSDRCKMLSHSLESVLQ